MIDSSRERERERESPVGQQGNRGVTSAINLLTERGLSVPTHNNAGFTTLRLCH